MADKFSKKDLQKMTQDLRELFADGIINHDGIIKVHVSNSLALLAYFDSIIGILVDIKEME